MTTSPPWNADEEANAPERYDRATHVGAATLRRLRDARVGADTRNRGMYAVYFYDEAGEEIRVVGKFATLDEAARGVYLIWAEQVLEDVAVDEADTYDGGDDE